MSLYILDVDKVSENWVDKWSARGFEIAGHPHDTEDAADLNWNNINIAIVLKKNEMEGRCRLSMRTDVNHWFVWRGRDVSGKLDFASKAKLEGKNGIELYLNYAHYDLKSHQGDNFLCPPGTKQGNFNSFCSSSSLSYKSLNII